MKKIVFLSLIISFIIVSCAQQEVKSPIEGAWRMIRVDSFQYTDTSFQGMIKNSQIKTWSKEYFTYVGHDQVDTLMYDYYGGGTYKLDGNKYEEHILYSFFKPLVDTKFKALLEIRNDTLIQRYNTDIADSYDLRQGYTTEVFIRLK
jgi:hypothetical protein